MLEAGVDFPGLQLEIGASGAGKDGSGSVDRQQQLETAWRNLRGVLVKGGGVWGGLLKRVHKKSPRLLARALHGMDAGPYTDLSRTQPQARRAPLIRLRIRRL